jgi:C-terminal peptidase prc
MRQVILSRCIAVLASFLLLAASARGADPQTYAVVVGVGEYGEKVVKARPRAEADARAIYDLLTNKEHFNIPAAKVKFFLGSAAENKDKSAPAEPATHDNIAKALHWAFGSAKEDDTVLLFWFGQGGPFSDRTCYFTTDTKFADGKFQHAVTAADIEQEFDKAKSHRVAVFLDVNFRGYDLPRGTFNEAGLQQRFEEFLGKEDDAEQLTRPIVVVSANEGISPSQDLEKQGLFASVLLEALKGKADTDGGEADSQVTIDEVFTFLDKEMPKRSRQTSGRLQYPFLARRNSHYTLTRNPEAVAQANSRLEKFEELIKADKVNQEIAREGRDFLSLMPRFETQREMRKRYQELADGKLTVEELLRERQMYLDSLKVTRQVAEQFADNILKVAQIAREGYVKQVELHKMVAEAIKGLYRATNTKLTKDMTDRIDNLKSEDERGLKKFLADARENLGNRDDLKGAKATDIALQRMLHSLDPYSTYIDAEALHAFDIGTKQEFIGVGIQIQKDLPTDMIRVSTPLRGSPAHKAGIVTGDIITKIVNKVDKRGRSLPEPEIIDTKGLSTSEVVKKILGKEGTPVTMIIRREMADGPKELTFELKRSRIQVETVLGAQRKEDESAGWDYYIDRDSKLAYIRLTQFALNTERDLKNAIKELEKEGINGLILDLRFNPGGYLDSAVGISDLFIDDGAIVSIRPRVGRQREFKGTHAGTKGDFPLVVLVNGGSASASEIVSACIQDHERGIVMGERSFGKGSVQNIMELDLGNGPSEMKLTTASFWRPSGKNLHKFPNSKDEEDWGVRPHATYTLNLSPAERAELYDHLKRQEVIQRRDPPKMETVPTFTDRQLEMAIDFLKKQVATKTAAKKAG